MLIYAVTEQSASIVLLYLLINALKIKVLIIVLLYVLIYAVADKEHMKGQIKAHIFF